MPQVAGFVVGALSYGAAAVPGVMAAGWAAGATFAATTLGGLAVKLLTTVAMSALQSALTPSPQGGGVTIPAALRGEDNPETIILGRYATAGQVVYTNSHGGSRRYLTQVIELCSAPGATLNRLMLGDQWVTLGETADPDYGYPIEGEDFEGKAWLRYYDGTQTTADPMLIDRYGDDPDRPWAATAVGSGLCYAILTLRYSRKHLSAVPSWRFELDGIPCYDPRADSTAGGAGPQRLANPATWAQTDNPAVMAWNILHGLPLPGGEVWGGQFGTDMLPAAAWMAAMNACDTPRAIAGGGTEPAYRAGIEAPLTQEPAQILVELLKACSGTIADMGYAWLLSVGAPGLPVYAYTDDDVIVSKSQSLDPFPSLSETYNAVSARYPDPAHLWETKEAPLRTNASWEASDAFGRRTAALTLPAVPYKRQTQRLMRAWIEEERRFRRHILNLPPDAAAIELTDTIDWSSVRNGYEGKLFSVHEISEDLRTGIRQVSIRERDPADYDWTAGYELPMPAPTVVTPVAAEPVSGFYVHAVTLTDAGAQARRPAIEIGWDADQVADGVQWQIRLAGQTAITLRGDTLDLEDGFERITAGILPATSYEVRAQLIARRRTTWTGWVAVTTDPVYLGSGDVSDEFVDEIEAIADLAGVKTVGALPPSGDKPNQIVCLTPPGRLYRWDAGAGQWTQQLYAGIEAGSVDKTAFANSIKPVEIVSALPGAPHVAGRVVYLTTDGKLYRNTGTAWTAAVPAVDVTGQITAAQLGTGAVLTDKISDGALTTAKFANGIRPVEIVEALPGAGNFDGRVVYLTTDKRIYRHNGAAWVNSNAADQIVGQLVAGQIAAGAISTTELAAGAITADKLAVGGAVNWIGNSGYAEGLNGWLIAGTGTSFAETTMALQPPGNWAGSTYPTLAMAQTTGTSDAGYADLRYRPTTQAGTQTWGMPVQPGDWIEISARLSVHRCTAELRIEWRDAAGTVLSYSAATVQAANAGAIDNPATWVRPWAKGQAPANASFAGVHIRKRPTDAGQSSSYVFVHQPQLCASVENATSPSPYTPTGGALISGEGLLAGSVVTEKLAAAAITADKIAANAITTDKIAANAITSGKIAAGSVTTNELAANAVTAGKVAAGAIGADQVAAGAIATRHLFVGDTSNMIPDAEMRDTAAWSYTPGWWSRFVATGPGFRSAGAFVFVKADASTGYTGLGSTMFPVEAGRDYYFGYQSTCAAGITYQLWGRVDWYDGAGNGLAAGEGSGWTTIHVASGITSGLVERSKVITAPAGAKFGRFLFYTLRESTSGNFQVGSLIGRRATSGELIVDGAITAEKLSAGEVITNSAQIKAAIINDAHIANLSVTTAKIANGAIGTAKIADAAINNAKIDDLAVDTLKIADRAVTVPNFSYVAGTVNVTSDTTEVSLASISFTRDAGFSTRLGIALTLLSGATSGSGARMSCRVYRGSTLIHTFVWMVDSNTETTGEGMAYFFVDTNTGGGATTYSVRAVKTTAARPTCVVSQRSMEAIQFKK